MRFKESSSKRKVYGSTVLPQETRKISNNLTLHLKLLEKEEEQQQQQQKKTKISRRKEVINIRAEINEMDM